MTKEILEIINPVHLPTCEDWMKIAEAFLRSKNPSKWDSVRAAEKLDLRNGRFFLFQYRFEELTRGKYSQAGVDAIDVVNPIWQPALLTKQMFVSEKFRYPYDSKITYEEGIARQRKADEKVWFEGFEKAWKGEWVGNKRYGEHSFSISFKRMIIYVNGYEVCEAPTVFDFLIELDRYNRTAKEKISIHWTENFINELLKSAESA